MVATIIRSAALSPSIYERPSDYAEVIVSDSYHADQIFYRRWRPFVAFSCAVTDVSHEGLGQVVYGVAESDGTLTRTVLLDYLRSRFVRYRLPHAIDFVTKLVRGSGKVRRTELNAGAAV